MQVILPGDSLPPTSTAPASSLILGPGLTSLHSAASHAPASHSQTGKGKAREDVYAVKGGLLGYVGEGEERERWWVEGEARRVSPVHSGTGERQRHWQGTD